MRASIVAAVLAVASLAQADRPAEPPVPAPAEDPEVTAAREAAALFFLAIGSSEDGYLKAVLKPNVAFAHLGFEDPACTKQFAGTGTVGKPRLGKLATCLLSLARRQSAGELAFAVSRPTPTGPVIVAATNPEVTIELELTRTRDGTYQIAALRSPPPPPSLGAVGAPTAADLARYTRGLPGKGKRLIATIATSHGTLTCELFGTKAPRTVANFIGLATGKKPWLDPATQTVKSGVRFYDGLIFHRVIPGFMIQGGDPQGTGTGGPGYQFDNETSASLVHTPGTLSMANAGPDTNGSQFFVTEVTTKFLDGGYSVFGRCAELDVVKAIAGVPRDRADRPNTPVTITSIGIARAK